MSPGRPRAFPIRAVLWGCLGAGWALGCGARASVGPADDESAPATATGEAGASTLTGGGGSTATSNSTGGTSSGAGGGATGGGGSSGKAPFQFETHELPACDPGFQQAQANGRSCKYRFDGLCYEDETAVCACACPRSGNSSCVLSGFLGDPSQPLQVRCTAS